MMKHGPNADIYKVYKNSIQTGHPLDEYP